MGDRNWKTIGLNRKVEIRSSCASGWNKKFKR